MPQNGCNLWQALPVPKLRFTFLPVSLFALLTLAFAVAATPARAMTIDHGGGVLTITGTPGNDSPLFSHDEGATDPSQVIEMATWGEPTTLTPAAQAAGCAEGPEWDDTIVCPRPSRIVVNLLAGDDSLSTYEATDLPFTVPFEADGGPGNDTLDGASGNDTLSGGDGNDALTGRDGDDSLYGQAGDDVLNGDFSEDGPGGDDLLDGGAGNDEFEQYVGFGYPAPLKGDDTYIGGAGYDRFSYFHRSVAVRVTLDGKANDGMAGESDNVGADIEEVGGGSGDDLIVGTNRADELWGSDGDDTVRGNGGNDTLWGNEGDDLIEGGAGNDKIDGGCMTDRLIGGPGQDEIYSDGTCSSSGLRSPLDRIEANDGERDKLIFCQDISDQAGDVAVVDPIDPVTKSGPGACKNVVIRAGKGGRPKGKVKANLKPNAQLLVGNGKKGSALPQRIVVKRRRLTLGTLFATKRTVVTVSATVKKGRKAVSLGRARMVIPARRAKAVNLTLSRKALAAVTGKKKVAVTVSFKVGKKTHRKQFRVAVR